MSGAIRALLLGATLILAGCAAPATVTPTPPPTDTASVEPTPAATPDPRPARSAELEAAAVQWAEIGYAAYSFRLERNCFCLEAARGPFEISVIGTDAIVTGANGKPVADDLRSSIPATVPELFAFLRTNLDAERFDVTYDAETGVPLSIYIDASSMIADEETGFTISGLAPYTVE